MIKVTAEKNKVFIKGHAGYAKEGEDIVCAAVSAIFWAFVAYLQKRGLLKEYKAERGDSYVVFDRECKEALLMFTEGIKAIAESYPENVSI